MNFYIFPIFLMLYEFTVYMSNDMYNPAFPMIANYFAVNEEMVQLTLSSWLLGGATAQVILGPVSDKYGRRTVLFYGGILFLLSCVGCITASNIYIFIASRFFQGIGVCSMMIAGYACIHDTYKDRDAVNIISLMSGVSITAPMLGPLFGGLVITFYNWKAIFYVIFTLALFAITMLYFVMPKDMIKMKGKLNIKSISLEYLGLIHNQQFISYAIIIGALYSGIMLWIATSPFILMKNHGLSAEQFGLLQIPIFVAFTLGTQVVRLCIDRLSLQTFIKIGLAGMLLGGCTLLLSSLFANSVTLLILSMMICCLGSGITSAPLNRLCFNASKSDKGLTASMFYTCMMGMGAFITIIFSFLYNDHVLSFALMQFVTIIIALLFFVRTTKFDTSLIK